MIRSRIAWLAVAAGAIASGMPVGRAEAQRRPEPQLLLTIMGGATSGGRLYTDIRQPLPLLEDPAATDTMLLGRELTSAILLGASATYLPSPSLGFTAEISFVGLGRDDTCRLVHTASSPARAGWNEQICNNIAAASGAASTIAFEVGGMYRPLPGAFVKPYLLAHAGITTRLASTVELAGAYIDNTGVTRSRLIIADPSSSSVDPSALFGLGVMFPFAAGYQARLEFRDRLMFADRITGPADALAHAPTERTLINSLGLVVMLDIVLEQRRGRRY